MVSRGLVDRQIFVVDVAGGDKVPRKGGPGVTTADLLVISKTDLAPLVGADLSVMHGDATRIRGALPVTTQSLVEDPAATDVTAWVHRQIHEVRTESDARTHSVLTSQVTVLVTAYSGSL